MLPILVAVAGIVLILAMVWDAFEALVLPRTASRNFRPARLFYNVAWPGWSAAARLFGRGWRRENFLAVFGPLSFLLLMACWAVALLVGFAMVQWGLGSHLNVAQGPRGFGTDLYMSGTTLFTLGIGAESTLGSLRALYEPYVAALAARLRLTLPPWRAPADERDDWRTSAWESGRSGAAGLSGHDLGDHPPF